MPAHRLSAEECLERLAKIRASGLSSNLYLKVIGYNKGYEQSALKSLKQLHGYTADQIDIGRANYIDVYRSYMDAEHKDRVRFLDVYEKCNDLGFNDLRKSAALGRYLNDNGYDEYWYRKMRTSYEFYSDVFRQLTNDDKLATINKNSSHDGPLEFVVTTKSYPITKSEFVAKPITTEEPVEEVVPDEPAEEPTEETISEEPVEESVPIPTFICTENDTGHKQSLLTITAMTRGVTRTVAIDFPFDYEHASELFALAEKFAKSIFEGMTHE